MCLLPSPGPSLTQSYWSLRPQLKSHLFLIAAVTNYYKFCGLKQYKFIILQSDVWSHCAIIKALTGLCFFLDDLGENLGLAFFFFLSSFPSVYRPPAFLGLW